MRQRRRAPRAIPRFDGRAMLAAALVALLAAAPARAQAVPCTGTGPASEATPAEVEAYVKAQGKRVLTFVGYSGAEYENQALMLVAARSALTSHDPRATIVNIGATIEGIGAVYELARTLGFATMGIVSTQARDTKATLSPCVDRVFFIRDQTWGGLLEGQQRLSPTSAAMVAVSDEVLAIGGGDVSRDELAGAERAGRKTSFVPADMNHEIARARAKRRGEPEPTDFAGPVAAARRQRR
ncbi:MAG: hypothetical protein AB7O28_01280 [Vicinamibacterales bacterium]